MPEAVHDLVESSQEPIVESQQPVVVEPPDLESQEFNEAMDLAKAASLEGALEGQLFDPAEFDPVIEVEESQEPEQQVQQEQQEQQH